MAEVLSRPPLFEEKQAAAELGVSVDTLRRERKRGCIGYVRIGKRKVTYTEAQLRQYIEAQTVEPGAAPCQATENSGSKSDTTGCPGAQTPITGAERGSTQTTDRRVAFLSAQKTLRPQK